MPPENPKFIPKSMTPANFAVSKMTQELSHIIVKNHPQIEQDYRDGLTCREIATKYNFCQDHHVGIRLAIESVRLAVKILIPDSEERIALAQGHAHRIKDDLKK